MTAGVCVLPDGLRLWVEAGDREIADPVLENRYELNELDFIRRTVGPGAHVLDLGAHIGTYTVRLASLVGSTGSVIAIEPHRRHVESLGRALRANDFLERVRIVEAAAADTSGSRDLIVSGPDLASCHAWLRPRGHLLGRDEIVESVETVALDDLLLRRPVSFIRIDVEGAEALALRGARRLLAADQPVVLVELHPHLLPLVSRVGPAECIAGMARLGYDCRLLGAGLPGAAVADTPSRVVTSVVFLPLTPADTTRGAGG
jgi:FkbM family methyltransferase